MFHQGCFGSVCCFLPVGGFWFIYRLCRDAVQASSALLLDLDNATALLSEHRSLNKIAELSKESTQDLRALSVC